MQPRPLWRPRWCQPGEAIMLSRVDHTTKTVGVNGRYARNTRKGGRLRQQSLFIPHPADSNRVFSFSPRGGRTPLRGDEEGRR